MYPNPLLVLVSVLLCLLPGIFIGDRWFNQFVRPRTFHIESSAAGITIQYRGIQRGSMQLAAASVCFFIFAIIGLLSGGDSPYWQFMTLSPVVMAGMACLLFFEEHGEQTEIRISKTSVKVTQKKRSLFPNTIHRESTNIVRVYYKKHIIRTGVCCRLFVDTTNRLGNLLVADIYDEIIAVRIKDEIIQCQNLAWSSTLGIQ